MTASEQTVTWAVHTVNSRRDVSGNCYWFATYRNLVTGNSVTFHANHRSNAEGVCRELAGDWAGTHKTTEELPIREWNRRARGLEYLNDCDHEEAAQIIRDATA